MPEGMPITTAPIPAVVMKSMGVLAVKIGAVMPLAKQPQTIGGALINPFRAPPYF
jgi:hypothetical protein